MICFTSTIFASEQVKTKYIDQIVNEKFGKEFTAVPNKLKKRYVCQQQEIDQISAELSSSLEKFKPGKDIIETLASLANHHCAIFHRNKFEQHLNKEVSGYVHPNLQMMQAAIQKLSSQNVKETVDPLVVQKWDRLQQIASELIVANHAAHTRRSNVSLTTFILATGAAFGFVHFMKK